MEFTEIARRVMREKGFDPDFGRDVESQVAALSGALGADGVRDLRGQLWSSIDNAESRDLDQLEVARANGGGGGRGDGTITVRVAIADVDALVPKGSPADVRAYANATSVYTGVVVFPMLPERLSTNLTSLNEDVDRLAIVVENDVTADGEVAHVDVYRALVRNHAKLAYDVVGAWLERTHDGPTEPPASIARIDGLSGQILLQHEVARRLAAQREQAGALELETIEATPVAKDGRVVDLRLTHKTVARDLIEDFMIASNIAIAKWLEARGRSGIRRVVRQPERWSRIVEIAARYGATLPAAPDARALARFLAARRAADPLRFPDLSLSIVKLMGPGEYALDRPGEDPGGGGHFGLAAHDYSHATAPNRRYADLVTQRLVKAALADRAAPYSDDELAAIAQHCTEREDAARKVERTMRKVAAAAMLAGHRGEEFDAIVTGDSKKGTYVRLVAPPAEGRVVRFAEHMDVGDRVRVRLVATDPQQGWIDFEGVRPG